LGCIRPLFRLNLDLVFFKCNMPVMLYFACSHNSKYTHVSILICLFVHGWANTPNFLLQIWAVNQELVCTHQFSATESIHATVN
jgi:hypothetical protein